MRPIIRTSDDILREQAAALRSVALELEQLADGEPLELEQLADGEPYMPLPPLRPKLSWHESLRVKRMSIPAAGGWAAAIALAIELVRVVLEHVGPR